MSSWFKILGISFVSQVVAHVITKLLIKITKFSSTAEVFNMVEPSLADEIQLNDVMIDLTNIARISGKVTGNSYDHHYSIMVTYKDNTERELLYHNVQAFNKDCTLLCVRAFKS